MRLVCLLGLLAVAFVSASPAAASEAHPTLAELETEVMCPTCHTLLEVSDAPVAQRMRVFIKARIAAGDTKGAIKDKLVAQFGEAVLAAPPRRGLNLVAWVAPMMTLIGGCLILAWRARRAGRPHADGVVVELDAETEHLVAHALAQAER